MSMNIMIWTIIGCAIVTWLPRIIPFLFVKHVKLPAIVMKWLSFIPICILSALVVENLLVPGDGITSLNWSVVFAFIPTLLLAIWTKSLSVTVLAGVISMAIIRIYLPV